MALTKSVINEFKELYSLYMAFLVVFIGFFTYFVDGVYLRAKGNMKESSLAKIIGIIYIIGGPLFYVLIRIL
ncbi:hypothetical protein TR13x_05145 [Caloranaerobacter sp. TR13]|uniref:CLC_0170 family protein n=1 Tax=Caloranaerobacter sp. TR13 TaxID=1302151 RepID=UPI0006D3F0B6|nr:CLC_0170 family protein [Caloranaerobacter sp. TR13]KPU27458.1 hypothetical protein TR13x_05145 [Caloranaerobacter sp. TR13]